MKFRTRFIDPLTNALCYKTFERSKLTFSGLLNCKSCARLFNCLHVADSSVENRRNKEPNIWRSDDRRRQSGWKNENDIFHIIMENVIAPTTAFSGHRKYYYLEMLSTWRTASIIGSFGSFGIVAHIKLNVVSFIMHSPTISGHCELSMTKNAEREFHIHRIPQQRRIMKNKWTNDQSNDEIGQRQKQ